MGLVIENNCCGCATESYPCLGSSCPRRHDPHLYCDECEEETTLYYFDDEMLCLDCIQERLDEVDIDREVRLNGYY